MSKLQNQQLFYILKMAMRKGNHKSQQSCTELSKFKFIPAAKLHKVKNPSHFRSLIQSNSITTNEEFQEHEQFARTSPNHKQQGNSNDHCKNAVPREERILRSISNPKLHRSNSRNAVLTQKAQPCQAYKNQQQTQLDKLIQFINELQDKDVHKNAQIAKLRDENKSLIIKMEKINFSLAQRTKQVNELNERIERLQNQIREKNHQHNLIVDSLKKVIESQVQKISEMKAKQIKMNKIKNQMGVIKGTDRILERESMDSLDDSLSSDPCQEALSNERVSECKVEKKCQGYLKFIRDSLNDQKSKQGFSISCLAQVGKGSLENSQQDPNKIKHPTPDFGARTPTSTDEGKVPSLECSIEQENQNLTLSRISQSVQQDFETSRDNIALEEPPNFVKATSNKASTHQQLLDEIDQYLSKKTCFRTSK